MSLTRIGARGLSNDPMFLPTRGLRVRGFRPGGSGTHGWFGDRWQDARDAFSGFVPGGYGPTSIKTGAERGRVQGVRGEWSDWLRGELGGFIDAGRGYLEDRYGTRPPPSYYIPPQPPPAPAPAPKATVPAWVAPVGIGGGFLLLLFMTSRKH